MRKYLFMLLLTFFANVEAQTVTNLNRTPSKSDDGTHQWRVYKVEVYDNCVLVQFEITALRPIKRLNIYSDYDCRIEYGEKGYCNPLRLQGDYENQQIKYLGPNSTWGWDNVGLKEKRYYTLYFGGKEYGNGLPSGVSTISIYGVGIDADGEKVTWRSRNININTTRKNYTNFTSEYSIKHHIDSNNDGICGIYEVIGDNAGSKLAVVKYNGLHTLIFISDNLGRSWWTCGDIKARLNLSASGIFKADWFMSDKSINKDCYIVFDGTTMTVTHLSGTASKKAEETKYLKMYPTYTPSNNNSNYNNREQTPQRRQTTPQQNRIPQLKKQTVK